MVSAQLSEIWEDITHTIVMFPLDLIHRTVGLLLLHPAERILYDPQVVLGFVRALDHFLLEKAELHVQLLQLACGRDYVGGMVLEER